MCLNDFLLTKDRYFAREEQEIINEKIFIRFW